MHQRLRLILGSALAGALVLAHAPAASSAVYLKLGDIKGESTAPGHEGEIEVLSWSFGTQPQSTSVAAVRSAAAAGAEASARRNYEPIKFTKRVDKSSPLLQRASADRQVLPSVTLQVPDGGRGQQTYLTIELENVLISSYSVSGSGDTAIESLSLNYEKIKTAKHSPPRNMK